MLHSLQPQAQTMARRIVMIATIAAPADYHIGALMRLMVAAMSKECRDAGLAIADVDTNTDLTGTLALAGRVRPGCRRIGVAVTVRVPAMTRAYALRDRCEARVTRLLAQSGIAGAVAPYVADAESGVRPLASFR